MKRGEVFEARLDPTEGSEQAGNRPVVIVSRDVINQTSPVVVVVPCTTYRAPRRLYPSHVLLRASEGGLQVDSVALCEQIRAVAKARLGARWGVLGAATLRRIEQALLITLDLPGQDLE